MADERRGVSIATTPAGPDLIAQMDQEEAEGAGNYLRVWNEHTRLQSAADDAARRYHAGQLSGADAAAAIERFNEHRQQNAKWLEQRPVRRSERQQGGWSEWLFGRGMRLGGPNVIHQMIGEEAARGGVDPELALAIAAQESNFNPWARNPRSSAFGLYQFIDSTWRAHGITPRSPATRDPMTQIRAGLNHIRGNRDALSVFLGRTPEAAEVYMAHVFGLVGAQRILGHSDDTPITQTRPQAVFDANPWIAQAGITTVGQMRQWFQRRTERRLTEVRGLLDPTAIITPPEPTTRGAIVTGADILTQEADRAQWPLHRYIPDDARLRPSNRAAGALEAIGEGLEGDSPIRIGMSRRRMGRRAQEALSEGFDVDLSSLSPEARQRFLALAMQQGFTSFGFSRDRPDVLTMSMDAVGTATFRDSPTGRNFLRWGSDGQAQNFPQDHWAAPVMNANFRRGRTLESPIPGLPEDPRHVGALTPAEAARNVANPSLSLTPGRDPLGVPAPTTSDVGPYTPFTEPEARAQERETAANRPGLVETAGLAISNQWSILWAVSNGAHRFQRDPDWTPAPAWIKENFGHLPTRFWDGVQHSLSESHARFMVEQAERAQNIEQRLGSLGWGGVAANLVAAILDPAAIALAIGSDGTLAPWLIARKVGTAARILAMGASAATQNAGLELLLQSEKPGGDSRDILYAALGGLVLGSAFAARPGHLLRDGFEALSGAADRARRTVAESAEALDPPIVTGSRRTAGAGGAPTFEPLNMNASDALQWARENPAARPAYARARFDAVAQTLNSRHPLAAKTMDGLGEDAVGRVGHETNTLAATEYQTWYHRLNMNEFYRVANPAWDEFAEARGLRWFHFRERARAYEEFHSSVTRRIRQGIDAEGVSPQAERVAKVLQDRFEKMLGDLKEPGKVDGVLLPPVKGFENVSFNRQYAPRIWHAGKVSAARAKFGDDKMGAFFANAYLARNPHLIAGGEARFVEGTKLIQLFGKTFWKRLRQHRAGVTDDLNRALSGEDLEALRTQLREAVDDEVSKLDIDKIVDGLRVADHGGMARAQQRAMLDENFSARMGDKDGNLAPLRVDDLLENSAERLFQMYSRNISGALAMARLGYPSLRDFERRLAHIRASAEEVKGYDKDALEKDIRNLEYVATYVTGSPVGGFGRTLFDARGSRLGEYARVVRDLNFIRLMGQLGFAQAAETFSIMGHMGIRTAMASMPSLRSMWRNARTGKLDDNLAHELEVWVGLGTDRLRNSPEFRHEDFGTYLDPHEGERMAWVQGLLNRGKVGVGELSGANMVNSVLHRWAMRGIAQKFSELADNPAAWNARRLAAYGLGPEGQVAKDILEAIKAHRTTVAGTFGRKLAQFNLDKWPEDVAENFSLVMHRVARHVIQENDPGNLHAYMSHPASQLLFQFRHFMLVAHTKQLLHGIHMRDAFTATTFLGTSVSAGIAYILQTYAQSVGQRDRTKFLEERLSTARIGAASFSRAGWSSLLPLAADNVASGTGFPVPFGTRYSGLQPTGFLQNPTFDFANALYHIPLDAARAALRRDFDYSQQDFQRFRSVLPFQNANGITQALQLLGSNLLPERSRALQ